MIERLTKKISSKQQTQVIKDVVEKRLDVLEHDVFTLKELNKKIITENAALKEKHDHLQEKFKNLKKKAGENCGMLINARQEKLKNDLIVITSKPEDPLGVVHKQLISPKTSRQTKGGKFLFSYSFKNINDKLALSLIHI